MKILFVTEKFPYPLDTGGNIRSYYLLKGLAQKHKITLIATNPGDVNKEHLCEVGRFCENIRLVEVKRQGFVHDIITLAHSLVNGKPFILIRHERKAVRKEILSILKGFKDNQSVDAIYFNHLDAALYESIVPDNIFMIIDEHNVVTNQVKTSITTEQHFLRKLILRLEYKKLRDFEVKTCNKMDLCLACSDTDTLSLVELGVQSPVVTIPNGVDLEYFSQSKLEEANTQTIIFVGTLDYDPCEKGVWYFCNEILPLIRKDIPNIRFIVVGRNPSNRLNAIAISDQAIMLTGRVDDIRPYVQEARVFVVPLLSGSGTRLKILEAMSMGVPVVTTSIGVEGIEAINGEHLLIKDTSIDFAKTVVKLLCEPSGAREMVVKARQLVENKYSWDIISQDLLKRI